MSRARLLTLWLAAAGATVASGAHAEGSTAADKQACNGAYSQAQTLRDAHKLAEAREQLRTCARPTCAAFIVSDCTSWLVDTEARIPSVVLIAKDGTGSLLSAVTVSVDGTVLKTSLDGQSVDVDPGTHTFTFVATDGTKIDRVVVVPEGQKAQNVTATFTAGAAVPPATSSSFWTTQHTAGALVGGAGLIGVVVGAVFGGLAMSASSAENADCGSGPTCLHHTQALSDHSSAVTDGAVSTVGFIAGGALVAGGLALVLTGGRKSEATAGLSGLVVVPSVGRSGGGASLRMEF